MRGRRVRGRRGGRTSGRGTIPAIDTVRSEGAVGVLGPGAAVITIAVARPVGVLGAVVVAPLCNEGRWGRAGRRRAGRAGRRLGRRGRRRRRLLEGAEVGGGRGRRVGQRDGDGGGFGADGAYLDEVARLGHQVSFALAQLRVDDRLAVAGARAALLVHVYLQQTEGGRASEKDLCLLCIHIYTHIDRLIDRSIYLYLSINLDFYIYLSISIYLSIFPSIHLSSYL